MIEPRVLDEDAIAELSAQMRRPDQRRADLRAQLAAGRVGGRRLLELHERVGAEHARGGVRGGARLRRATHPRLHRRSSRTARTAPATCSRRGRATSRSCSRATVDGDRADARLHRHRRPARGQPQLPDGGHPLGVLLRDSRADRPRHPAERRRLPAGRGVAPEGCLLNARSPAAVVGGNVETSSRVADVVLQAFGRALGQGTMNNVTLGDEDVVYYETIGGGQGACPRRRRSERRPRRDEQHAQHPDRGARARVPDAHGASTRCVAARAGPARYRGGDGVIRELEALAPLQLLADHRATAPRAAGRRRRRSRAAAGATCSTARSCPAKAIGRLEPGQRLRIETPGGGGYGRPE